MGESRFYDDTLWIGTVSERSMSVKRGLEKLAELMNESTADGRHNEMALHEMERDHQIDGKRDGELSYDQRQMRVTIGKYSACVESMAQLEERVIAMEKEVCVICKEYETAHELSNKYGQKVERLARKLAE